MGRLIDADTFEKFIEQKYKDAESTDDIKDQMLFDLYYQPTAYDVEKVVAELEKRRSIHNELSQSEKLTDEEKLIQTRFDGCFTRAIAIVRNGGKE